MILYYFSFAFNFKTILLKYLQVFRIIRFINYLFTIFNLIILLLSFPQNYKKDNDREQRRHLSVQTNRAVTKQYVCQFPQYLPNINYIRCLSLHSKPVYDKKCKSFFLLFRGHMKRKYSKNILFIQEK